jgi:hypothetical protein
MTIPETVGGSGVKLTGVGTTVAVAVGGGGVAEGLTRVGTLAAVEVGCDDVGVVEYNALTGGGGTVADSAGVGNADVGDAGVVGCNALAEEQATSPHSTSTAPTMTCPVFLILLPNYIAA